jgi:hypothetical protein
MNLHLVEISKQVAAGAHAVLLLDGAGYHQEAALELPPNMTLLPLPAYFARTQSGRKHLGLSARQQARQHGL